MPFLEKYLGLIHPLRWVLILGAIASSLYFASHIPNMVITTDYRAFFSEKNPELIAFDHLENTYVKTDYYLIAVHNPNGDLFSKEYMQIVSEITEAAWQTPHATRVDSVTNFQHSRAEEDDIFVNNLVEEPQLLTKDQFAEIKGIAVSEPSLINRLISKDGATTGIMVTLQFPPGDNVEYIPNTVEYSRALLKRYEDANPELKFALSGLVLFDYAMLETMQADSMILMPVMFLLIIVFIWFLLRSISATVITMAMIAMSAMSALGLGVMSGIVFTSPSSAAPLLVLTLALANAMHILVAALSEMDKGTSKNKAIIKSLQLKFKPVFITTLTTIIGFSSLNLAEAPPIADLGNVAAAGIFFAWFSSMTFLPAAWIVMPFSRRDDRHSSDRYFDWLSEFVIQHRKASLSITLVGALLLISLIPNNQFGESFIEYFHEEMRMRQDTDFITSHLTGPYTLEFSLESGDEGGISEPNYLEKLDQFAQWLRGQDEVMNVSTYVDVQKRLNKSMHGDQQTWYKLPESRELAAQYLLLYELSLPYGLDLTSQINIDKSATRLIVTLNDIHSVEIRRFKSEAESWLIENAPVHMQSEGASSAVMFAFLSGRMVPGMLISTLIAFLLIGITLMLALKSFKLGLLSMIPNIFPAAITLGIWSILVGEIGMIASLITALTMGLVVDDSVHILSTYIQARRDLKKSPEDSIRYTFRHVGKAVWSTTIVLAGGFLVLASSDFVPNHQLGALSAMTISVALILDFFMLPPLLLLLDKQDHEGVLES